MVNGLSEEQLRAFAATYRGQRKNPTTVLLLALFLGGLGAHYFYLGKTGLGVLYLLTLGILWIGAIIDCFRHKSLANQVNLATATMIAANLR